jgi:hypothetical protein
MGPERVTLNVLFQTLNGKHYQSVLIKEIAPDHIARSIQFNFQGPAVNLTIEEVVSMYVHIVLTKADTSYLLPSSEPERF